MQASPYYADNKVVCWGEGWSSSKGLEVYTGDASQYPDWLTGTDDRVVVGSNIGFDLQYARKTWPEQWERCKKHIYIWDCQQVEYLLSGHTHIYPSLDEMCTKYGFPLKDDRLKEYWHAGVDTEAIPKEILLPYQEHDVQATYYVFRKQLEVLKENANAKLFNLVKIKMDDILATVDMEWNGMQFDIVEAMQLRDDAALVRAKRREEIEALVTTYHWPDFVPFNIDSPTDVGTMLFGGEIKYVVPVDTGVLYKTGIKAGQPKFKKEERVEKIEGLPLLIPALTWKTPTGKWKVDDEVLSAVAELGYGIAEMLLDYRELEKDISTYYEGYSKLVWPDGRIHPSLNHSATVTGRQSCTSPNLQNTSRTK